MHPIHHTDAVILRSQPAGEANRRVWLFTRDFGLIVAMVQGVRKQGAKLQMQLEEYSFVTVDLVKGRDVWRLVNVIAVASPLHGKVRAPQARTYVRSLSAIERFCQGEEANKPLFEHLTVCADALAQTPADTLSFDTVSLWKVSVMLGYGVVSETDQYLFDLPLQEAVNSIDLPVRKRLIIETNKAIKETHL